MRTLVIADIHEKYRGAQSIIDSVPHDSLVLTGDYFDSPTTTVEDAKRTAYWLKEQILPRPNTTVLLGNHDVPYLWLSNPMVRFSGFSIFSGVEINKILTGNDRDKFKAYHIEQGHLFTHAGLSNPLWKILSVNFTKDETKPTMDFVDSVLNIVSAEAIASLSQEKEPQLFAVGWDRCGMARHGGINWSDWNSFSPVKGVNQVVGHSRHRIPRIFVQNHGGGISERDIIEHYRRLEMLSTPDKSYLSLSYDLDTGLGHYMVIEDGVVNIYDVHTRTNLKDLGKYAIPDNPLSVLR